jgi:hypothetical protein
MAQKKISLTNSSSKEELFLNWLGLGQIGKMLRVSGSEVGDEKRKKKYNLSCHQSFRKGPLLLCISLFDLA